jgi:hypothetical protein
VDLMERLRQSLQGAGDGGRGRAKSAKKTTRSGGSSPTRAASKTKTSKKRTRAA